MKDEMMYSTEFVDILRAEILASHEVVYALQKLVRAQDRLLIAYRLGRNPGNAPEDAQKAKASLKKLGVEV
jgi:hypothetical protein